MMTKQFSRGLATRAVRVSTRTSLKPSQFLSTFSSFGMVRAPHPESGGSARQRSGVESEDA